MLKQPGKPSLDTAQPCHLTIVALPDACCCAGLPPLPRVLQPGRPDPQVRHEHLPPVLPRGASAQRAWLAGWPGANWAAARGASGFTSGTRLVCTWRANTLCRLPRTASKRAVPTPPRSRSTPTPLASSSTGKQLSGSRGLPASADVVHSSQRDVAAGSSARWHSSPCTLDCVTASVAHHCLASCATSEIRNSMCHNSAAKQ